MSNLIKLCPKCGSVQLYSWMKSFNLALKNNTVCKRCCQKGKIISDETKLKLVNANVKYWLGKKRDSNTKHHMSENHVGFVGRKHTEETKERIRILKLERVKKLGGGYTRYNPTACEFIDKLNNKFGWKLQHAKNGGEVTITGYSVDGYDKEKNIVFEYDEHRHNCFSYKQKDLIRQKRIIDKITPSLFLRYDEENDKLYDVISFKQHNYR